MTTDNQGLDLTVTVSAAEWAGLRRRVTFLEAVSIQLLRDGEAIKEWFSVAELAALRLPDMPTAKNAISRLARERKWQVREVACQGGVRHVYHFSDLPRRAFETLIDRIVKNPPDGSERIGQREPLPPRPNRRKRQARNADNAAPPWLLPLMRVIRVDGVTVADALDNLPSILPRDMACPTREEAVEVLTKFGLVKSS